MKIAYLITRSDEVGGAHVHVRDMARYMADQGHGVVVLVGGEGLFVDMLRNQGTETVTLRHMKRPLRPWDDWRALNEVTDVLRRVGPDIVSCHSAKMGIIGRRAAFRLGIPAVFTAHGWAFADGVGAVQGIVYRFLERWAERWSNNTITVCESDRRLAIRAGLGHHAEITTIHNGMPPHPDALATDVGVQPPNITMIARFERQKDHATLVTVLSRLKGRAWTVTLVGDGPLRGEIEARISEAGLTDRVTFAGRTADVVSVLRASQIFVLASLWEGFPRSILEAMRAGLPVVASDVGGVAEAVADDVTGYAVPRRDADAMAQCLGRLIDDPGLRRRLGAQARRKYDEHFAFETMARATALKYESVLARR